MAGRLDVWFIASPHDCPIQLQQFDCMRKYLLLLLLPLIAACSVSDDQEKKNANYIMINDFEAFDGWIPANGSLNAEQAHSGKYSIKVDQAQEYSMGFRNFLGKVSARKPYKVKLSCWAYLPSNKATAHYQLQILDPVTGEKIFEDGIVLTNMINDYRTWVKAEKTIKLPENIAYSHEIRVFLWRADAEVPVYIDDVSLVILE